MRLFLYGTLMGAADTPMSRWLGERVASAVPASAPGRMLVIPSPTGWFPALLPGSGRVRGMLADIGLAPGELAHLDRYEGREYRRGTVRVRGAEGLVTAQAYLWRAPLPVGALPVPGGDFLAWLAATGAPILKSRNGT